METTLKLNTEYKAWLTDIKTRIRQSQIKASFSVNCHMIMLYWDIGKQIVEKQEKAKWGSGFINQFSEDLKEEFPEMKGFSRANLFRMKKFYQFYSIIEPHCEFVAQPVRQLRTSRNQYNHQEKQLIPQWALIPWGHNVCIFEQVKEVDQALFYIHKTIENNWSRLTIDRGVAKRTDEF